MSSFLSGGGGGRTILTTATTYYASPTGSDSNPGTLAKPWATIQHAVDFIGKNIDSAGQQITIQLADGTYAGPLQAFIPLGNCFMLIEGDAANNSLVTINDTGLGYGCWQLNAPQLIQFQDLTFNVTSNTNTPYMPNYPGTFAFFNNVAFTAAGGVTGGAIIANFQGGSFNIIGASFNSSNRGFSISGAWSNFILSGGTVLNYYDIFACTLVSTPSFSDAFVNIDPDCFVFVESSFGPTGTATGKRFTDAGTISGPSLGLTTLPGNAAGTVNAGAVYKNIVGPYPNINTQTVSYTLVLTDVGKIIEMNLAGANTVTVPTNASVAFPIGSLLRVTQVGAGATTVQGAGGVTVDNAGTLAAQWNSATLYKRGTDEWVMTL